jgi:hypothetical protein
MGIERGYDRYAMALCVGGTASNEVHHVTPRQALPHPGILRRQASRTSSGSAQPTYFLHSASPQHYSKVSELHQRDDRTASKTNACRDRVPHEWE